MNNESGKFHIPSSGRRGKYRKTDLIPEHLRTGAAIAKANAELPSGKKRKRRRGRNHTRDN